ncbi:MAG: hypothetical protein JSV65_13580 [Armatimonadota bacterium]|nr:MAG: hypothetical protein JSV65_13580 [Armatimonadota bacterium]
MRLFLVCREDNDLYRVITENGMACTRVAGARQAIDGAPDGAGVMLLADGYPDAATPFDEALCDAAAKKRLRLYVEFPAALPEGAAGEPQGIVWERGVVASDAFAPDLERLRILAIHGCRFVPVSAEDPHLVMARVAGLDTAVYGLPQESSPVLFEHPRGDLLVATTNLSQFVTARYAPVEAWRAIWHWILRWVTGDGKVPGLSWTPTVRPSYGASDALPGNVEAQAFRRGVEWFPKAKLFPHSSWEGQPQRRFGGEATSGKSGAEAEPPLGDGSLGVMEGASSAIHPDGSQEWSGNQRSDCIGETAMAMAFSGAIRDRAEDGMIARNLADYVYFTSVAAQGPRADPASPSFGLVSWGLHPPSEGVYYGDDNARCMLGTLAAAALLSTERWDKLLLRCLLANLRTTGPLGFRSGRIDEKPLQENGWRHYWTTPRTHFAPHYEAWLWAALLWAYGRTGFAPFLERPKTAIRMTMEAYPDEWQWTNGIQQERARMLLPLAWLVRVEDTEEHRQWLRFMAQELLRHQDACGALREEIGATSKGSYGPPQSNEDYGTSEATLIQANGDPVCDLLYTTNFAFVGLHEAAAATDEALYTEAEDKLAKFLCRIQVRSEKHAELDGAWFRAFEFRRWEYWGSSADLGWGVWSIESGWTQGWIASVLAMRQMKTSLWDLMAASAIRTHLDELVALMLPECARSGADEDGGTRAPDARCSR